ncbi:chorismate mutase family protein [Rhizobium sp. TRM95111]|uniref:chorismate mutase family protein n=1 Tax=Rhizobium alarense TaxID=2846851 RepID=UPI001F1F4490|nr:chorismate mutase family protein [Rhizobium alarense]MCF3641892.1 chorismate mutase family protein [Rhizobium alarense]
MTMRAADCTTMAEIRENIDRIDEALMVLLAERWTFIGRATEIKSGLGLPADIPERVAEVRRNARLNAGSHGLDPDFYEDIWSQLIDHAIAHEKRALGEAE